jgi:hypothetical protein
VVRGASYSFFFFNAIASEVRDWGRPRDREGRADVEGALIFLVRLRCFFFTKKSLNSLLC